MLAETVSVLALIVSGVALRHTIVSSKHQTELTLRETELVRIQIDNELSKKKSEANSSISARMYKDTNRSWKVRIYNPGPANVKNVTLKIAEDSFLSSDEVAEKFPLAKLENGHFVELIAFIHLQSKPKEDLTVYWQDEMGGQHENRVTLIH